MREFLARRAILFRLLTDKDVIDHEGLDASLRRNFDHLTGGEFFVDDNEIIRRMRAPGDFAGLLLHEEVIAFGIDDFQVNVQIFRRGLHKRRHGEPKSAGGIIRIGNAWVNKGHAHGFGRPCGTQPTADTT